MTSCRYAFLSHSKSESQETPAAQIRFRVTHYGSKSLWHRAQLEITVLNREHRKQNASSPELLVQEASYEATKKAESQEAQQQSKAYYSMNRCYSKSL